MGFEAAAHVAPEGQGPVIVKGHPGCIPGVFIV